MNRHSIRLSVCIVLVGLTTSLPSFAKFDKLVRKLQAKGVGEISNLIVALDYTGSNTKRGAKTFGGNDLHFTETLDNPYQVTLKALGDTLFQLDGNCKVPLLGFGDERTKASSFFTLHEGCSSPDDALKVYNQMTPTVVKDGPTNFAPVIRRAIELADQTHALQILVIVTDGEVEGKYQKPSGAWVDCEQDTRNALIAASHYPISIIGVGVGDGNDGKFGDLEEYDKMGGRKFDNFQFVKFSKYKKNPIFGDPYFDEEAFAEAALDELPEQLKKMKALGYL